MVHPGPISGPSLGRAYVCLPLYIALTLILTVPSLSAATAGDDSSLLPTLLGERITMSPDTLVAVHGTVRDAVTDEELEGAIVRLSGPGDLAPAVDVTDEMGRFLMGEVTPGRYELSITRLGYDEVWDSLTVTGKSSIELSVGMVPVAIELEPLMVRRLPGLSPEMAGFEERRERGIGRFLSRDQIETRGTSQVSDLFRQLPGITVERTAATRGGGGGRLFMRGNCPPSIYLDGQRAAAGPVDIDAYVSGADLEAVEIYSASQTPPQFSYGRCGAVVLWTRPAAMQEEGRQFSWGRLALAAGFLGASIFLRP